MNTIETNPNHEDTKISRHTPDSATGKLKQQSQRITQSVSNMVDTAKNKSSHLVDESSNRIGSSLGQLTEASDKLRRKMESGYESKVAPAINKANQKLADTSTYLKQSSPADFLDDVFRKGRTHPRATIAVLLGAGFLIGRLFTSKSSQR